VFVIQSGNAGHSLDQQLVLPDDKSVVYRIAGNYFFPPVDTDCEAMAQYVKEKVELKFKVLERL